MSEQSIASARASVLLYDAVLKKWVPSGTSAGLAKVHIYHHVENHTFRVVGRKVQDHEVVINCSIQRGLKYFQATDTFHQWRDSNQIHGLNFPSTDDASTFALAMERVLDILGNTNMYLSNNRSSNSQHLYQTIGHSGVSLDDYAEYRGWVGNENGERKSSVPTEYGHYRISQNYASQPVTPQPPQSLSYSQQKASPVPPQPSPSIPPPPPPPPGPGTTYGLSGSATLPRLHLQNADVDEVTESSLAHALANAKLKKTPVQSKPETTTPVKGMASMIDEMAKTLARRRAKTDSNLDVVSIGSNDSNRSWSKQNSIVNCSPNRNSGEDSPQSLRRCDLDNSDSRSQIILDSYELEKLKQDIFNEIKTEMHKIKQDIIDAIRTELNRR